MTYLVCAFVMALAAMLLAPDAPVSRWLKRLLVERPFEWLGRRKREQIALWILFAAFITLCIWAPDMARGFAALFASGMDGVPIIMALLDGSVMLEILMAVWLVGNAFKPLWRVIRRAMDAAGSVATNALRIVRRQRARDRKRPASRKPRKPDDSSSEPGWQGLAFA
ncbi:MAG TPA: hypothetical protein VGO52_10810 [Hyphomonadaceae bacterium]|jgi:hypothetical protein|nr:hypothetical protein [Hyphomonadaceae bacterium]